MAIYQRARPTRFDEVVGQDHVKEPLAAAVRRGAIGHAYLFSGPRGVGKTTTARLLAMAVNCRAVDESERPCGRCESCTLIQRGSHPDVTELDAASNNSVEDVRDLREKVRLAPLGGGTRVWILDEAHMLSRAAANALLKTLEEPPPGLLFVLATTESEKLPATVLSRCQHFRFRRLSDDEIQGKLDRLVREAGREAEPSALALVARAADGAMRDAESLLERLLSSGRPVTRADAEDALGLPARDRLWSLATALAEGDLGTLLEGAADLYRDGFAPRTVAEQLARTVRDALVATVTDGDGPRLDVAEDALVRALHALDDAEERFVRRGDLYALEVSLIRAHAAMAGVVATGDASAATDVAPAARGPAPAAAAERPAAAPPAPTRTTPVERAPTAPSARAASAEAPTATARAATRPVGGASGFSWHQVLSLANPQLKAFLFPAEAVLDAGVLLLRYGERHAFHFGQLASREQDLYAVIDQAGGSGLGVVVEGPSGRLRRTVAGGARAEPEPAAAPTASEPSGAAPSPAAEAVRREPSRPAAAPAPRASTERAPDEPGPAAPGVARGAGASRTPAGPVADPAAEPAAEVPPSDTMESLPDGFWDAAPSHGSERAPRRADPAPTTRARATPAAAARTAPPPRDAQAERRDEGDDARTGTAADGDGLARLRAVFNGRVIAVEPHPDEAAADDDVEVAPAGPAESAEGTA